MLDKNILVKDNKTEGETERERGKQPTTVIKPAGLYLFSCRELYEKMDTTLMFVC